VRCLDVDHRVEDLIPKGQVLRIALHERQPIDPVSFAAERDAGWIQIEPRVARRPQGPGKVRRAAAMPTTDLENVLAAKVRLSRDMMIELDATTVGLVRRLEDKPLRRDFLECVVQKQHVVRLKTTG
jgi:hypothetical protein